MYIIDIMAERLSLAMYFVCRFSYYVLRNCIPFVVCMLNNVRLYGPSHVSVDTPSVTLLEYLSPKLLLWSWLFRFS